MAPLPATPTAVTQVDYPPAASQFRLSLPAIIGIVVAGVGFLVLSAVTAAFIVCFLDRKRETKPEKEIRKRRREGDMEATDEHASEKAIHTEIGEDQRADGNVIREDQRDDGNVIESSSTDIEESLTVPRYGRMIGVDTTTNTNTNTNTQSLSSAAGKEKQKENE
ncbi:hypothetical protein GJ744_003906 [Endocarpon pusillum]|uniref:Uncharacterized protein n=1 Tax=Endocarpon pusillum TaxID=364733 RepID=A0A8H7A8K5_9EURO|nr:hypothetical protein GJ744_003906 [Endocarpon pusillum]